MHPITLSTLVGLIVVLSEISAQFNPNQWVNRNTIVHLFEWKWNDVADECERFLAPKGYAGVQVGYFYYA